MPLLQSAAPRLHLERARGCKGSADIVWCDDYWWGECPDRGWWWKKLKVANKPPFQPKYTKTVKKSCTFWLKNC